MKADILKMSSMLEQTSDFLSSLPYSVIEEISKKEDEMIFKMFEAFGFDNKYLMRHLEEFEIIYDPASLTSFFYHNHKLIFTGVTEFDLEDNMIRIIYIS